MFVWGDGTVFAADIVGESMSFKMLNQFRSYGLAVKFYRATKEVRLPRGLQDQLNRASSSIALNLAEGYGKRTKADQRKFYHIALGSARECEAIVELEELGSLSDEFDVLVRHLVRLCSAMK